MSNQTKITGYGQLLMPTSKNLCHTIGTKQPASATKPFQQSGILEAPLKDDRVLIVYTPTNPLIIDNTAGPTGAPASSGKKDI
mmetsp:Transcript_35558/g.51954  ORF Transcript_35558/g.51954 Transcript_35558/m.51954 type:complete len:83 (+) Transcript_35558:327-575(+)